jgi:murE/murF fusion protein
MKLTRLLDRVPVRAVRTPSGWDGGTGDGRPLTPARLSELTAGVRIGSIHFDSREVAPGGLFVAMTGQAADGHDHIGQALERGAAAVVCQRPADADGLLLRVADSRLALSRLAATFYDDPTRKVTLIGVTGTNGKTTVTYLLEKMLISAGFETGVIGTVNYRHHGRCVDNPRTTPEALDLQRIVAEMQAAGVTHVVMEVASHGIALHRVADCHLDVAVFTNLTQDHLDFHGDMAAYWACKRRLFTELLPAGCKPRKAAVVNQDDAHGAQLLAQLDRLAGIDVCIATGEGPAAQVRARDTRFNLKGIRGRLRLPHAATAGFASALVGRYNLHNILSAAGAAAALAVPATDIIDGIAKLSGVPGRIERVSAAGQTHVYVDYAHTPDALDNVLSAVRDLTDARLICVFGCGGDRDRAKRAMMGARAAAWSDLAVVTSDNPRSEDPLAIIDEILPGVQGDGRQAYRAEDLLSGFTQRGYVVEADRRRAIALAVAAAAPGDAVVIAGKGHETYQEVNGRRLPFDDGQVAREVLSRGRTPSTAAGNPAAAWTADQIIAACGGERIGGGASTTFGSVGIDSRSVQPGQIFVAIRGETHDGHGFAADAVNGGATAVIFEADAARELPLDSWRRRKVTCIAVPDTTRALGDLARYHRDRIGAKVVAITGSNGKTSTRRMTAGVLSRRYPTLATRGNLNNAYGLPLTLLRLKPDHQWAVVEMGMNHAGEIRRLARICRPDIGLITNIGPAHLAFFDSVDAIARAKAELLEEMTSDTAAVLNSGDDRRYRLARDYTGRVVHFGDDDAADVIYGEVAVGPSGVRFDLDLPGETVTIALATPAVCMAANASAAAAVGSLAGLGALDIQAGLNAFQPVNGRMQTRTTAGGVTVVDDSYNANPTSMGAAITTLARAAAGRRVLVAGDMLELGDTAPDLHREIGRRAAEAGLDRLYVTGAFSRHVADGAEAGGMAAEAIHVGNRDEIAAHLAPWLQPGDWVLVKGSRAMGMERIVAALTTEGTH